MIVINKTIIKRFGLSAVKLPIWHSCRFEAEYH